MTVSEKTWGEMKKEEIIGILKATKSQLIYISERTEGYKNEINESINNLEYCIQSCSKL